MTGKLSEPETPNPNAGVDPHAIDLGDDVQRTPGNQGFDQGSNEGLEGGIDPGATDLGDDVRRPA